MSCEGGGQARERLLELFAEQGVESAEVGCLQTLNPWHIDAPLARSRNACAGHVRAERAPTVYPTCP